MRFTGERLVPGVPRLANMIVEELARLEVARPHFQGVRALDFGCGAGYAADHLRTNGASCVVGIDRSMEATVYARSRYRSAGLSFARMDCLATAFAPETFGFVCSLDVIEHFDETDMDRALAEIQRLLTADGCCLITTPNRVHTSTDRTPSWQFHLRELSYDELCAVLGRHFRRFEVFGSRVPVYEDRAVRRITNSPLSRLKHYLPSKLRVWFSSGLRYLLKPDLEIADVVIGKKDVAAARVFVALCWK